MNFCLLSQGTLRTLIDRCSIIGKSIYCCSVVKIFTRIPCHGFYLILKSPAKFWHCSNLELRSFYFQSIKQEFLTGTL